MQNHNMLFGMLSSHSTQYLNVYHIVGNENNFFFKHRFSGTSVSILISIWSKVSKENVENLRSGGILLQVFVSNIAISNSEALGV